MGLATSVDTLSVDLRTRTKRLGAKEKASSEVFLCQKKWRISEKNYMRMGVRKLLEKGFAPCESVERAGSGHRVNRKVEIEEADGGSRQESVGVVLAYGGE